MLLKKILSFSLFGLVWQLSAQSHSFNQAVYFETNQAVFGAKDSAVLAELAQKLANSPDYEISISAYTDDRGSVENNQLLAARRSEAVIDYLKSKNLPLPSRQTVQPVGEISLQKGENAEVARRQNRRVDIIISTFAPQNMEELFGYFQKRNQTEFKTFSTRDTVLIGQKGTVLSIPVDAFAAVNGNNKPKYPIQIELREAYDFGDMLANNVSTVSDGQLIQTGGMVFVGAKDANGAELKLAAGKEIQVAMPAKGELPAGMQLFTANRSGDDNTTATNWKPQEAVFTQFDIKNYKQASQKTIPKLKKLTDSLFNPLFVAAKYPDTVVFELPIMPILPQLATVKAVEPSIKAVKKQFKIQKKEKIADYEARIQTQYNNQLKGYNRKLAEQIYRQNEHTTAMQKYEIALAKYNQALNLYQNSRKAAFDYFDAVCAGQEKSTFIHFYNQFTNWQEARVSITERLKAPNANDKQADYLVALCQMHGLNDLYPAARELKNKLQNVSAQSKDWTNAHKKAAAELYTLGKQMGWDNVQLNFHQEVIKNGSHTSFYRTVYANVESGADWKNNFDLNTAAVEKQLLFFIQNFHRNIMNKSLPENHRIMIASNVKLDKLQAMEMDADLLQQQSLLTEKVNKTVQEKYLIKARTWLNEIENDMATFAAIEQKNINTWRNYGYRFNQIQNANFTDADINARLSSLKTQYNSQTITLIANYANKSFAQTENTLTEAEKITDFNMNTLHAEMRNLYTIIGLLPYENGYKKQYEKINEAYVKICNRAKIATAKNDLNQLKSIDANGLNTIAQNLTTISSLGWVNCDRFYNETNLIHTQIIAKANETDKCYLVFTELNLIVPMEFVDNHFRTPAAYKGVPADAKVKVVGLRAEKGTVQTFVFENTAKNIHTERPVFQQAKIADLIGLFENI